MGHGRGVESADGGAAFNDMVAALAADAKRRRKLWEKRCRGKFRHRDQEAAQREVERMEAKYPGQEYNWYACPDCRTFHVGHKPPWVRRREMQEEADRLGVVAVALMAAIGTGGRPGYDPVAVMRAWAGMGCRDEFDMGNKTFEYDQLANRWEITEYAR